MRSYAAFFRNLNLGRPNCPDKAQLEAAFLHSGAGFSTSFLTNGTLVFSAATPTQANRITRLACQRLQASCGLAEPVFVRSVASLAGLTASDPFAGVDRASVYEFCITFFSGEIVGASGPAPASGRADVELLHFTDGEAFSLSRVVGRSPGSPNALLERMLGLPCTSRAWNTVVRLVQKHG